MTELNWKARAEAAELEAEHQRKCAVEWFDKFRAAEAQVRELKEGPRLLVQLREQLEAYMPDNGTTWRERTGILEARVRELEEALEPFAKAADDFPRHYHVAIDNRIGESGEMYDNDHNFRVWCGGGMTYGDLRRARSALSRPPAPKEPHEQP